MENDVIDLLDILYGMISEAYKVPLGNDRCIIEREKAIEVINEIKAILPTSLAEAKRLVAARDEFIGNAKKEAEALRKSAEEKARSLVEEQQIVKEARAKAGEMISSAEAKSKELRRVASEYVDDLMKKAEFSLNESLSSIKNAHTAFTSTSSSVKPVQQQTQRRPQQQGQPQQQQQRKVEMINPKERD